MLGFGRSVVLGRDKHIQEAVERLEKLTSSEDLLVGAETHIEVTRQGRTMDRLAAALSESQIEITQGRVENLEMYNEVITLLRNT